MSQRNVGSITKYFFYFFALILFLFIFITPAVPLQDQFYVLFPNVLQIPLALFHVLFPADLRSCFHGIQRVSRCVFVNRWKQTVTDGLMMIPHYPGSLSPRISSAPHPACRLFSSRTSSRLRRALDYSFLFVLTPSSSNQNAVFFLRPLTGAFRHNGHANSTLSDAAASFVSFYCRSHSAYASMRGMKRAVE